MWIARKMEKREHELKLKDLDIRRSDTGNFRLRGSTIGSEMVKYLNMIKEQLPKPPQKNDNWIFFYGGSQWI